MRIKIFKIIFVTGMLILFFSHVYQFQKSYIQFSTSSVIYKLNLQKMYYYMLFVEITSILFLIRNFENSRLAKIYDVLFSLYFLFLVIMLININIATGNCIDCHYFASFFYSNYKVTLFFLGILGVVYLFFIRNQKNKVLTT